MSKRTQATYVGIRAMVKVSRRSGFHVFPEPRGTGYAVAFEPAPGGYFPGYETREAALQDAYKAAMDLPSGIEVRP